MRLRTRMDIIKDLIGVNAKMNSNQTNALANLFKTDIKSRGKCNWMHKLKVNKKFIEISDEIVMGQ